MQGNSLSEGLGRPRTLKPFPGVNGSDSRHDAYADLDPATVRRTAIAYWGEIAELCYDVFDHANAQLYGSLIPMPLFQICRVMPYGKCIGLSHTTDLDRPVIDIFASLWKGSNRYANVAGIVLHELLHFHNRFQWQSRGEIWYRTSHENELWLDAVRAFKTILNDDTLKIMDSPYERWPLFGPRKTKQLDAKLAVGKWPW